MNSPSFPFESLDPVAMSNLSSVSTSSNMVDRFRMRMLLLWSLMASSSWKSRARGSGYEMDAELLDANGDGYLSAMAVETNEE